MKNESLSLKDIITRLLRGYNASNEKFKENYRALIARDINFIDEDNKNLLHLACEENLTKTTELLLNDLKFNPTNLTKDGRFAIELTNNNEIRDLFNENVVWQDFKNKANIFLKNVELPKIAHEIATVVKEIYESPRRDEDENKNLKSELDIIDIVEISEDKTTETAEDEIEQQKFYFNQEQETKTTEDDKTKEIDQIFADKPLDISSPISQTPIMEVQEQNLPNQVKTTDEKLKKLAKKQKKPKRKSDKEEVDPEIAYLDQLIAERRKIEEEQLKTDVVQPKIETETSEENQQQNLNQDKINNSPINFYNIGKFIMFSIIIYIITKYQNQNSNKLDDLLIGAIKNDEALINKALAEKSNPNIKTKDLTALCISLLNNNNKIVETLVNYKASTQIDCDKTKPFFIAFNNKNFKQMNIIINAKQTSHESFIESNGNSIFNYFSLSDDKIEEQEMLLNIVKKFPRILDHNDREGKNVKKILIEKNPKIYTEISELLKKPSSEVIEPKAFKQIGKNNDREIF